MRCPVNYNNVCELLRRLKAAIKAARKAKTDTIEYLNLDDTIQTETLETAREDVKKLGAIVFYCERFSSVDDNGISIIPDLKETMSNTTGRFIYADDLRNPFMLHRIWRPYILQGCGLIEVDVTSEDPAILAKISGDTTLYNDYISGNDIYAIDGVDRDTAKKIVNGGINGASKFADSKFPSNAAEIWRAWCSRYPVAARWLECWKNSNNNDSIPLWDGLYCSCCDCERPSQRPSRLIQAQGAAFLRLMLRRCNGILCHCHDAVYLQDERGLSEVCSFIESFGFRYKIKTFQ